jgi:hypothetical protein
MSNAEYEVPECMIAACLAATSSNPSDGDAVKRILLAAIRWLARNPIVPSDGCILDISEGAPDEDFISGPKYYAVEWQRRMFLKRDTTPEELKPILARSSKGDYDIREAYELGKKAGSR